jgi:hypothetical protein
MRARLTGQPGTTSPLLRHYFGGLLPFRAKTGLVTAESTAEALSGR